MTVPGLAVAIHVHGHWKATVEVRGDTATLITAQGVRAAVTRPALGDRVYQLMKELQDLVVENRDDVKVLP